MTKKMRFTVIVDDELYEEIENFRFNNRYPSRTAAAVELMRIGAEFIKQQEQKPDEGKHKD